MSSNSPVGKPEIRIKDPYTTRSEANTLMGLKAPPAPVSLIGAQFSREECLDSMRRFAPIENSLECRLKIPDRLYCIANGTLPSYSSDKTKGIAKLAEFFALLPQGTEKADIPADLLGDLPEYGLHLKREGSEISCTLVDGKRGIVVFAEVLPPADSELASAGPWGHLGTAIEAAEKAAALAGEKNESGVPVINYRCLIQ